MKLHGSTNGNYIGKKKSLRFKLQDDEEMENAGSFSLVASQQHHYLVPLFANRTAAHLNLLYTEQTPVHVTINNSDKGLYWREEKLDHDFLVNRNLDNAEIIKLSDNWIEHMPVSNNFALNEISNIDGLVSKEALYDYSRLMGAVQIGEVDSVGCTDHDDRGKPDV